MTKIKNTERKPRELIGKLVSIIGNNTLKLRVESKFPHPKYQKIVKSHKTYLADYRGNLEDIKLGDEIRVQECKPVSQKKTWRFLNVTKKAE